METNPLLKTLINVFYYIIVLVSMILLTIFLYFWTLGEGFGVMEDGTIYMSSDERRETILSLKDYGRLAISLITTVLFIKTIYHLRAVTLKMVNGEMFNLVVVKSLKLTGMSMILYNIFKLFEEQYQNIVYSNILTVGITFDGFNSFIFILVLGLFFILLSQVIKNGVSLKTENDLTI